MLAAACTAPPPAPVPSPDRPPPLEDALPAFLSESDVDVPAAPRAPIRPRYPAAALSQGLEGSATLLVFVAGNGRVVGLRLVASDREEFTRAAAEAIRATSFEPARLHGRPVGSTVTIRVVFALEG